MKFIILAVGLAGVFPLSLLLRSSPRLVRGFWVVFGMLPLIAPVLPLFHIGLITWTGRWIGFVYSLELTILDLMAMAMFFTLPGRGLSWWCKLPALLFLLASALSVLQADHPLGAVFGVWQIARMVFILIVVGHACRIEPKVAVYILSGMAIGVAAHLLAVLYQRFGLGYAQTPGLFIHQNALGMVTHLALSPCLALLLYGYRRWWLAPTVAGVVLIVVFTASRGTIGFSAFGLVLTYLVLALAGLTQRKVAFAACGLAAVAIIAPLAMSSFHKRFTENPLNEAQYDERAAFNRTAAFILSDYPGGIGSNHYVHVAKNFGYASRAGVWDNEANRNNIVHNAYWLTAAETGWFGIAAYLVMLAVPLACAFVAGWRARARAEGALLLGLGVALAAVCLHSNFEWIVYTKDIQYPLSTTMGMIFGITLCLSDLARAQRDELKPRRPTRRATAPLPPALAGMWRPR